MNSFPSQQKKSPKRFDKMVWILLLSFLVFASLTAYLAFSIVKDAVGALGFGPSTPDIQEPSQSPLEFQDKYMEITGPLQTGNGPRPVPWDGESQVTMLLLGVDSRDWESGNGPPLTDTIILATIDPKDRTAGMLSIPRDLWVDVPGYGYHKINQAFRLGEANHEPEGGAGLLIDTIEVWLDISIPYYGLIDFNAFVKLVDELDGVKIDVKEPLRIDPLGDNNTVFIQPGVQTLPGDLALAYVRNRDTAGSDFDRIQRQQQVILGIKKRLVSFDMIPILIDRAPVLYDEIKSGIKTNLSLQQSVQLAWLAAQIPDENIKSVFIGHEYVIDTISWEGMAILQPIPEKILTLRDEFFSTEIPTTSEIASSMSPDDRMVEENAEIEIRNGTVTPGLAARTQDFLIEKEMNVTSVANADQTYAQTTIIDYTGKPYTVQYLAGVLNISPAKIYQRFDPNSESDIIIILGEDWAENNNLP